ncbi:uncharacterized protein LOC144871336 [Branchiostoma floridae x Branchiostoma japonicum]
MFLELHISWSDFPIILLLFIFLYVVVIILVEIARRDQDSEKILQSTPNGTVNVTNIQGDGNISVSAGSFSNISISTCTCPQVVEKPLPRTARLDNNWQKLCRKTLDLLGQLSANGELKKCKRSIDRLFQAIPDPDFRAALWNAAAINCINGGKMASAHEALHHVTMLLNETKNRTEHELRRDYYKSLIYLREEKCDQLFQGVGLTTVALQTTELVQVGCIRAWLWINHGWFYIKMANMQQNCYKQTALIKDAEESFVRASCIDDSCHEEEEFPGQLQDKRTRIRQCALIGRVYLRLRCWRSVSVGENDTKQGITDGIPEENIQEAQKILVSLKDREPLCGICEVLYHLAKAHLCYRFKQYPDALKEAEAARDLAINGHFKNYIDIAKSIVKLFR